MASGFGISQIKNETPKWAIWIFRITFLLTTAATGYIASTNLIADNVKYELVLLLKFLDFLIFGISKLFGVNPKSEITADENNAQT